MTTYNYRGLPKVRDSLSYIYVDKSKIEKTNEGVEVINKNGAFILPTANLNCVMFGPGTSYTQAAITAIAQDGCLIIWTGEEGVRYYAHSSGETYKAYKLQRQAELASYPDLRKKVALRMYQFRFKEKFPETHSFEQLQGMEGLRVQDIYRDIAKKFGIDWGGRQYDRQDWTAGDDANRALSVASSCLNGICHSAILAAGYSPGLGFIHQGRMQSFVYDIADLYKMQLVVPVAFATVADEVPDIDRAVRYRMRDAFKNMRLMAKLIPNIDKILSIDEELSDGFDPDADPHLPTKWWLPIEEEEPENGSANNV